MLSPSMLISRILNRPSRSRRCQTMRIGGPCSRSSRELTKTRSLLLSRRLTLVMLKLFPAYSALCRVIIGRKRWTAMSSKTARNSARCFARPAPVNAENEPSNGGNVDHLVEQRAEASFAVGFTQRLIVDFVGRALAERYQEGAGVLVGRGRCRRRHCSDKDGSEKEDGAEKGDERAINLQAVQTHGFRPLFRAAGVPLPTIPRMVIGGSASFPSTFQFSLTRIRRPEFVQRLVLFVHQVRDGSVVWRLGQGVQEAAHGIPRGIHSDCFRLR